MNEDIKYLIIVLGIAFLSAAILITITLFTVAVSGAVEEQDEVYDLCAIRFLKYKKGEWILNVGCCFDDNAILRLGFGFAFWRMFYGWEVKVFSNGNKKGYLTSSVDSKVFVLRRRLRRR